MAAGSLECHLVTQHGRVSEARQSWITPSMGDGPGTFWMALPSKGDLQSCPVEGCPGRAATRTAMRVHFLHQHVLDTVVILEEGNLPHPRCTWCKILVSQQALNGSHPATDQCARGAKRSGAEEAAASWGRSRRGPLRHTGSCCRM